MQIDYEVEQLSIFDLDSWCGRMYPEPSPAAHPRAKTSGLSSRRSSELKSVVFQSLDLTPGAGNLLGEFYWELISPWRGDALTLNTGVSPREESVSSLSQILQEDPPPKYYLTWKACLGILRRASERGKELPEKLKRALKIQSGIIQPDGKTTVLEAYHINQRDEGIDLHGVSGALMATNNMQMQTFVTQPDEGETKGFDGYNGDLTGDVAATLGVNCGMSTDRNGLLHPMAFAANQRDEVRDLHDVAGALGAQPGMKQQTFIAEGVVSKGNGDCFLTPDSHTSLSTGGGQAGQGYPCVLTAGFSAGAGATAGSIGYSEELAPTLKGSASGNCMPSILCLNDQGGQRMDVTEGFSMTLRAQMGGHQPLICLNDQGGDVMECSYDVSGTLRAQEHGHQPVVIDVHGQDSRYKLAGDTAQTVTSAFGEGGGNTPLVIAPEQRKEPELYENHGIDARYKGPYKVAPTMSARMGTGGNNVPLVEQEPVFCIAGNAIDRQPQNGGNGLGYQPDIAYTLTATDHHAVFSRQRVDIFKDGTVVSTQSARQHKDATDLVLDTDSHIGENRNGCFVPRCGQLIRRLTPLECERLQGFPDGWTDIPCASDSARYKALGNSVAIPCVDYVLHGIALVLQTG